jgi:hypothetical protein
MLQTAAAKQPAGQVAFMRDRSDTPDNARLIPLKSDNGAPTGSGKCSRPLDAIRTYSRKTGALCSGGTATR